MRARSCPGTKNPRSTGQSASDDAVVGVVYVIICLVVIVNHYFAAQTIKYCDPLSIKYMDK